MEVSVIFLYILIYHPHKQSLESLVLMLRVSSMLLF